MLLFTHPACLDHDPGAGHPECPDRLRAVLQALDHDRFAALDRVEAPRATRAQLARVHAQAQIDAVFAAVPESGTHYLDADTGLSPGSLDAALRAAGALVAAVDAVLDGRSERAFCAVRPPGHHATRDTAMGFCLFNNVAVGAAQALAWGLQRVAIVDFDVHHGNGSQEIFWADPTVMYASTHQMPLFPGTGSTQERGDQDTVVNAPLRAGNGSREFREAFDLAILPRLEAFEPELIVISAGFDAHWRDPLGSLELREEDYAWVTRKLMEIADKSAEGRIVSVLEGGYDLQGLRDSVAVHVAALMNN